MIVEEVKEIKTGTPGGFDGFKGGGGERPGDGSEYALPIRPAKFGLWLFIASIVMLFAAFTSAYIVRQSGEDWRHIELPFILWINTGILIMSSITMQWAYVAIKRDMDGIFKVALLITFLLGVLFAVGQFIAWRELSNAGIYLRTNPSSSFFYILTGAHIVHLSGGIIFLLYVLLRALRGYYSSRNRLGVELCATYWHFLDGLWVYLFIFLLVLQPGR
jgi:cytochrome c oxidase subunit 3